MTVRLHTRYARQFTFDQYLKPTKAQIVQAIHEAIESASLRDELIAKVNADDFVAVSRNTNELSLEQRKEQR